MKKIVKIILIILITILIILLLDTLQSKMFNNRPFLKITEDYNGGDLYQKDKGAFVYTYIFTDGTQKTVFRWEKYDPQLSLKQEENNTGSEIKMNTNINVIIDEKTYNAVLEENETAQSFLDMLPQEYNMQELNGNEKYIYVDSSLPTNSYNPNHIEKGDIMLYGNHKI